VPQKFPLFSSVPIERVSLLVIGAWSLLMPCETLRKGPATQNAVCRSGLRSLSAAECYILSRLLLTIIFWKHSS